MKIKAIQLAEIIDVKGFRKSIEGAYKSFSGSDFFKQLDSDKFIYVLDYGVVVFANVKQNEQQKWLSKIEFFIENPIEVPLTEVYSITVDEQISVLEVKNHVVVLPDLQIAALKIIMLNVAQSVALEYYETETERLITSSKKYIQQLENKGKIDISKKNLLKYIGQVLNVKNSIVDNLYILDDPNSVWESESLDLLNKKLKSNFEILPRFKDVDYRLSIVENNLKLFTEVLNVKESYRLEWVVIILIAFEIVMSFVR